MKLFVFPVAPNPTRVRLFLAEKRDAGADFEIEEVMVDLRKQEQRSPEHLERNPLAKLPVLQLEDGSFLTESLTIIEYLEERIPEAPMIGTTPERRARTREFERLIEMGVLRPIADLVHATASPLGLPPNPPVAEHFRGSIPRNLAVVEDRLADGRPLLMGEDPTIADCTLAAALQFGRVAGFDPRPEHPNLARWDAGFRDRVSAKQVLVL